MADTNAIPSIIKEHSYPDRELWSSRLLGFYFAVIGSAVCFGNVWRFPSLVYEYGGAAFLLSYLFSLFFVGLPILVLEISLRQYYDTGDIDVFGGIHCRLRGVGLSSVMCGLMLVTYCMMLLAWVLHAFFDTFLANSLWHQDPGTITTDQAQKYFENDILEISTVGEDMLPTRLFWANVGYSFLTWLIVFLCIAWGIQTTGRITYFTLGFPVLMLFIFLGRSITLEGADYGIEMHLNKADFSTLIEHPEVWPKAVSQTFFSLLVTFGIMTAMDHTIKETNLHY